MTQADIPAYSDLLWPTIVAVRRLGGSGSIAEAVVDQEGFTEEQPTRTWKKTFGRCAPADAPAATRVQRRGPGSPTASRAVTLALLDPT